MFRALFSTSTEEIFKAIRSSGGEARFVGGCVRDSILGIVPHDIDFAANVPPHQIRESCIAAGMRVIDNNGVRFGTTIAVIDGANFEITSLRKDIQCDGRHAVVEYTDNWQEDGCRRDFTFNAMYVDEHGVLYDFFNGLDDLRAGTLRFIGNPDHRIEEDYLRIMRVFRFYARFGKHALTNDITIVCRKHAHKIERLSGERIWQEIDALFLVPPPKLTIALRAMGDTNVIGYAFPGMDLSSLDSALRYIDALPEAQQLTSDNQEIHKLVRLALLTRATHCDCRTLEQRWHLKKKTYNFIKTMHSVCLSHDLINSSRKYIALYGQEIYKAALSMGRAMGNITDDELRQSNAYNYNIVFPITNQDIIAKGISGKMIGTTYDALFSIWLESNCTKSREHLLATLRSMRD